MPDIPQNAAATTLPSLETSGESVYFPSVPPSQLPAARPLLPLNQFGEQGGAGGLPQAPKALQRAPCTLQSALRTVHRALYALCNVCTV